jgi:hypothetical protein
MQFQHQIFFNKSTQKAQISLAMNNLIILHSRRSGQAPPLCTRVSNYTHMCIHVNLIKSFCVILMQFGIKFSSRNLCIKLSLH